MSKTNNLVWCLSLAAATAVASCGGNESGSSIQVSAAARQEAQQLFDTLCYTCHGKTGKGDGPGAAAIDPKPRDYTDAAWQASVTDDEISRTITLGGAAVGKSPQMPASPQLKTKPEVLQAIVDIVRSFAK